MLHAKGISRTGHLRPRLAARWVVITTIAVASAASVPRVHAGDANGKKQDPKAVSQGRAIFEREWQPGDSRTHGGDGLGPVYNDSSCVACHNQGGTGGAGSTGKNVDIITATPNGQDAVMNPVEPAEVRGFLIALCIARRPR